MKDEERDRRIGIRKAEDIASETSRRERLNRPLSMEEKILLKARRR